MIARQRAAHQLLDHGSIFYDPFAIKILREDEKEVLQFANKHPLASIGRLFTAARSRIAEDAFSRAGERGVRQIVILGAGLDTFALRNPHGAQQIHVYELDHPATQTWKVKRLAEAQNRTSAMACSRASRFRAKGCRREPRRGMLSAELARVFHLARGCAISDTGRDWPHTGRRFVNPELGGRVRLCGTPEGFSEQLRQIEKARTEQLEKIGERSGGRFEPDGIAAILRSHGFCAIEDLNFQEIASRFGGAVQGLAPGHAGLHIVHAKH
jgi:hypothetical protein